MNFAVTSETLPKLEQPPVIFADPELYKLYLSLSKAVDPTSLPSPELNHSQNQIYQDMKLNIDKLYGTVIAFALFCIVLSKNA